jgi:endonuclease YncB( thermonuclease family)
MAIDRLLDKMENSMSMAKMFRMRQINSFDFLLLFWLVAATFPANAAQFALCGTSARITCVVDGDTFWLNGEKFRLHGYDTPETVTGLCGGEAERQLE